MSVTAVPLRPIKKGSVLKLWLALGILTLAAVAFAWWGTQGAQVMTLDSGVRYRVLAKGSGPTVTSNDVALLRYKLHVNDLEGPVIEDSEQSGQPFPASVGTIFPGFGEALQEMREGGQYLLWLPAGTHIPQAQPGAPFTPNDTLVFEIEVREVLPGAAQMLQMQQMQRMQQMQQMMESAEGEGGNDDSQGRGRGRSGE